jgi:hypothetical protein
MPSVGAEALGLELDNVISNERVGARIARILAAKHTGLDEAALVGKAFDSLFRELRAEQTILLPTGEQVLAPTHADRMNQRSPSVSTVEFFNAIRAKRTFDDAASRKGANNGLMHPSNCSVIRSPRRRAPRRTPRRQLCRH